jgi:hypothetical protein
MPILLCGSSSTMNSRALPSCGLDESWQADHLAS